MAPGIVSPRRLRWKSMVRLRGKGLARLVVEEDSAVVYHCLQNSRSSHASGQDGAASDAGPSSGVCQFLGMCSPRRLFWFKPQSEVRPGC